MTRRERLRRIIRGEPVDRPGLSFHEIGGFDTDPDDQDPFNTYSSDTWRRLLDLAEGETDLIRMRSPQCVNRHPDYSRFFQTETYLENGSKFTKLTVKPAAGNSHRWIDETQAWIPPGR